jgi:elongation factor G
MADKHMGQLSFVRIYSGTIKAGSYAYNPIKDAKERVGRLMRMHANKREDIEDASAGENHRHRRHEAGHDRRHDLR